MSVSDVLTRISDIQAQYAQIQSGLSATATSTDSASSSTAFADALAAADSSSADGTATDGTSTDGTGSTSGLSSALSSLSGTSASSSDPISATAAGLVQNGTTGDDVLADAKKYLGVPYVFGGTTTSGMDCSGLVQTVFKDLGVTMPRVVPDQAKMGVAVSSLAAAKPGDLIVEKGNGHIQIYAGNGMILEAPKPGEDVKLRKEWLSSDQIGTIRRIVPSADSVAAAQAAAASAAASLGSTSLSGFTSGSTSGSTSQSDMLTAALQQMMSNGALS